jgi:pSer/pThr/pTyr-binding forkhead associated (FHA) protein
MAQLFVLSGPDVGKSFDVQPGDTIGRSPDCIVTVRHASVSRRHARLEHDGDSWYVVDDGSRNGVIVDGTRTKRAALGDMQEFSLGELLLRFRTESAAPSAPAPLAVPKPSPAPTPEPEPEPEDEVDGFVFEDPDEIEIEAAPAQPPPARERTTLAGRPAAVEQGAGGVGERVLQYSRVDSGGTFSTSELSQYPLWVRLGVGLLALALAAGLAWMAFHGTSFVKKQVGGGEAVQGD